MLLRRRNGVIKKIDKLTTEKLSKTLMTSNNMLKAEETITILCRLYNITYKENVRNKMELTLKERVKNK